jgi:Ca2+-binding RTX toxin-like protein
MVSHVINQHIHPTVRIVIEGRDETIPAGVGILQDGFMYSPHTHDSTGILHTGEPMAEGRAGIDPPGSTSRLTTLKDFFDVWRTTNPGTPRNNPDAFFSQNQILDRMADATHVVRMTVNGEPSTEFENYSPHDGDQVVIRYDDILATGTFDGTQKLRGGRLMIHGGAANNRMEVALGASGDQLEVSLEGGSPTRFDISEVRMLCLNGGPGDDTITIDPAIPIRAHIVGGAGNDGVTAGAGDDRISGGPGNDSLDGGAGRDVIRGDAGTDTVTNAEAIDRVLGVP